MQVDINRITKYLYDIKDSTLKIEEILKKYQESELLENEVLRLALKYLVIEIAEVMANILQHILAKEFGIPVKGYIDTIKKSTDKEVISKETFNRIKPLFDFRNSLIHRYWQIKDSVFIKNLLGGYKDFLLFCDDIENFVKTKRL